DEGLELYQVLLQKNIIHERSIEELIHRTLRFQMPLEDIIAAGVVESSKFRVIAMKERMLDVVRWHAGAYAFEDVERPFHGAPFARSLEAILSELMHRSLGGEELRAALAPWADTRFDPGEGFDRALNDLGFTASQREIASRLSKGKKLSSLIRAGDEDRLQLI